MLVPLIDPYATSLPLVIDRTDDPGAITSGLTLARPATGPRDEKPDMVSLEVIEPTVKEAS
jgi:hypothetical protein